MIPRLALIILVCTATTLIGGCGGTYVNVPKLDGSPASQDPNLVVVRRVEAEALRHVLLRYPPEGPYAIELPDGTDDATYWWVLRNLPEGGEQIHRLPDDAEIPPVYRVAQVVIRGLIAQVEVVIPPGRYEGDRLVSVFLSPDTEGWYANRSRLWTIPADQALRKIREIHVQTEQRDLPPDADRLDDLETEPIDE